MLEMQMPQSTGCGAAKLLTLSEISRLMADRDAGLQPEHLRRVRNLATKRLVPCAERGKGKSRAAEQKFSPAQIRMMVVLAKLTDLGINAPDAMRKLGEEIEKHTAEVMPAHVTLQSAAGDTIILNMSQWEGY